MVAGQDFPLSSGSEEEILPVYAADLEDPSLLDLDYLILSQTCIDFKRRTLKVCCVEVPSLWNEAFFEVVAVESTYVAPWTEEDEQ